MEQNSFEKSKMTPGNSYIQWIASLGVFLLMYLMGIQIGWASPNVARFNNEQTSIQITKSEISWVLSVIPIGSLIGSLLFPIALEFMGGRRVILVTLVTNTLSWMCLIIANSAVWLYIARLLAGLTFAGAWSSFSIYLGEVAQPKIRGTLISIAVSGCAAGIIHGIIAETYITSMKITSLMNITLTVMAIVLFLWLKDSPYYFAKIGDFERAKQSIAFYFTTCDVEEQLLPVKAFVEDGANESIKDICKALDSPVTRKSMIIIFIIFALPHFSGQINLMYYMETILKSAKSHLVKPQEFVIYANIINIAAALLTVKVSDKFGRRIALILSSIGTSIAMGCLGLHFYLLKENVDEESLQWLPIFSILLFLVFYAAGYNQVPSTVLSELFPENIKSLAVGFANFGASIITFAVTKAFQPIVDAFGEEYIFWTHAVLSLITIPCALFLLPETKGKTFQQIQNDLMK